jgi:hypothetical protein
MRSFFPWSKARKFIGGTARECLPEIKKLGKLANYTFSPGIYRIIGSLAFREIS